MKPLETTPKTQIKRAPKRAIDDREKLYKIIDSTLICHVAFRWQAETFVIPTLGWRMQDRFYIHGSNGSRMLKALSDGQTAAVSLAQLDGLVLARSAFHHSANYRSAVLFGPFQPVEGEEKTASLDHFINHLSPGRAQECRPANQNEMRATTVLAMDIEEASAKCRTGGPNDDIADLSWPVWAGEIPYRNAQEDAIPCPQGYQPSDLVDQEDGSFEPYSPAPLINPCFSEKVI